MTTDELRVFRALIGVLDGTMTRLGHPLQTVQHESLGLCSARHGCGETCQTRRALFVEAVALERQASANEPERLEQLPLAATAGMEG